MKTGRMLVGLCLGLVLVGQSCEEENQAPEARPSAATRAAPQTTPSDKDAADLLAFAMEFRGHLVTMTRIYGEGNELMDKFDAALDSDDCVEMNFVASNLNPRFARIINQDQKESAWLAASKSNQKLVELMRSGMAQDIPSTVDQIGAQASALHSRVLDMSQRLRAAGTACGSVR